MEFLLGDLHEILSVVDDLAALFDRVIGKNAEHGARRDRFSRTALSDDGERFALIEFEADVADRLHLAVRGTERDAEIVDFQLDFLFLCDSACCHTIPPNL